MRYASLEAGIADVVGAAALGMRQRCGDYQRPRRKQHGEGEGCVDALECHFTYFYFAFSILSTTSAVSIGLGRVSPYSLRLTARSDRKLDRGRELAKAGGSSVGFGSYGFNSITCIMPLSFMFYYVAMKHKASNDSAVGKWNDQFCSTRLSVFHSAGRRTARRVSTRCRAMRYARCGVCSASRGCPRTSLCPSGTGR